MESLLRKRLIVLLLEKDCLDVLVFANTTEIKIIEDLLTQKKPKRIPPGYEQWLELYDQANHVKKITRLKEAFEATV